MATETRTATAVVVDLAADLDPHSIPDEPREWVSSSVSEAHPGKRYHLTEWCEGLKAKHKVAYSRTVAEVAGRICGQCWTYASEERLAARSRQDLLTFLGELLKLARTVDCASGEDTADLERRLHLSAGRLSPQCESALGEVLTLRARHAAPDACEVHRAAALGLLPFTHAKESRTTQVPKSPNASTVLPDHSCSKGWSAFIAQLGENGDIDDARTAALTALLPLDRPYSLDQLSDVSITAQAGQQVNLTAMYDAWRDRAQARVIEVVNSWVERTKERVAQSDSVGALTVQVVAAGMDHGTRAEVNRLSTKYPVRLARAITQLELPAAVAAALRYRVRVVLVPSDTMTASAIEVVNSLIGEGLDFLEAVATARTVSAVPAHAA